MKPHRRFVRTTCAEAFPVFPHCGVMREKEQGPFYEPGAEWFRPYSASNLEHAHTSAAYWAGHGYTFTVDVVER